MGGEENGTGAYPVHGLVHSFDIEGNAKGAGKGILRMTKQITAVLAGDIGGTKTNLALRMLAFSGIYLGGGIPPRRPLNERQAVK
jgi:hypothetical protein